MNVEFEEATNVGMDECMIPGDLPSAVFPQPICRYIEDMAYTYQCPKNFIISAVMSAASAVIGNKVHVKDGKYDNPLMVWVVNVAKSGSNKTAPVRKVLAPLFEINKNMINDYIAEKVKANADGPQPKCHQLIISDATEEARLKVLNDNPNGILCYYPEIKGFFDDMGRYSATDGSSKLLRIFDGDDITVNRKTDENPWNIRNPFMNIIGDIQPDLMKEAFGNPKFLANGMNQRFLFNYEDMPTYGLYCENEPDAELAHMWECYIREFHNFSNPENRPLRLSAEAKSVYIDYFNNLQIRKISAQSDYERSIYSKCQIQILRVAGILHMFRVASNLCYVANAQAGVDVDPVFTIEAKSMEDATEMMSTFLLSALRVHRLITDRSVGTNVSKADAIKIINKHYPILNVSKFAESIGANRAYVSRIINDK